MAQGTLLYWSISGTGIAPADFDGNQPLQGTVSIAADGSFALNLPIAADQFTEGDETLALQFFQDSDRQLLLASRSLTLLDTSQTPPPPPASFSINAPGSVSEGSTLTINGDTTNVAQGTLFYWSISGPGIAPADFDGNQPLQGTVSIAADGSFALILPIAADQFTEGDETLTLQFFKDSDRQQLLASRSLTLLDTSQTPPPQIPVFNLNSPLDVLEGDTLLLSGSALNLPPSTKLFWSLSGAGINAADFDGEQPLDGEVTLTADGLFELRLTIASDQVDESGERLTVQFYRDADRSQPLGSATIVVNDRDTVPPLPPTLNTIAGDDRINASERQAGVTLSGTAEALSTVAVTWGSSTRTTQADAIGSWTLAYSAAQIPAAQNPTGTSSTIVLRSIDPSGNASVEVSRSVLLTNDAAPASTLPPERVYFQTSRSIPIVDERVQAGVVLGEFSGLDPDTPTRDLSYRLIPTSIQPPTLRDAVEIDGNQLRVAGSSSISRQDLSQLRFKVEVSDRTVDGTLNSEPVFFEIGPIFQLDTTRIGAPPDTITRSNSVVIPHFFSPLGVDNAILFSATELTNNVVLDFSRTLQANDLTALSSSFNLDQGSGVIINPYTPLFDFSTTVDAPGSRLRFEFDLPAIRVDELAQLRYVKLRDGDGSQAIYSDYIFQASDGTGARLERRVGDTFTPLNLDGLAGDQILSDVYMAVYIQDNGRGDDDLRLGFVRDPGLILGIRAKARTLAFDTSVPANLALQFLDPNGDGTSEVEFVVNREAYFDNVVNFYRVDNVVTGEIVIAGVSYFPNHPDYIALATGAARNLEMQDRSLPSLQVADLREITRTLAFNPDPGVWMPYVVVRNTGLTYVLYAEANPDRFAHFAHARDGGYDYFYVEDLPSGGDRDYDDIIIRVAASR